MFTNLSGKILPVAIVVLVISGVGYWYTSNFSPPYNVTVTDVTDTAAALVWETKNAESATVYFSKNPLLIRFLPLTLPWVHIKKNTTISVNHRVKFTGLTPDTMYAFAVGKGPYFYQVSRYPSIRETMPLPSIRTLPPQQKVTSQGLIYGVVRDYQFRPIRGAVVVAVLPGDLGRVYSDATGREGYFAFYVPEATGSMELRVFNGIQSHMAVPVLWDRKIIPITISLR